MDSSTDSESPAVLQLQRWAPSQGKFNLSEFRQAFISPTRQILLLLSYQHEALLQPLVPGDFQYNDNDGDTQKPSRSTFCSQGDELPCTSGLEPDFSADNNCIEFNSSSFIADVKSIAWGTFGETYNQHDDAPFSELLFVSGQGGVTVHAFIKPYKTGVATINAPEGKFTRGKWVDWGPSPDLTHDEEVNKPCIIKSEVSDTNQDSKKIARDSGSPDNVNNVDLVRGKPSKRWLRSFYTEAETIKSDGCTWTRLPGKTTLPCCAKIVSFSILGVNPSCHFNGKNESIPSSESRQGSVLDHAEDASHNSNFSSGTGSFSSDVLFNTLGVEIDSSCTGIRIFSSFSNHLVGFALTLESSIALDTSDVNKSRSRNLLFVARLHSWAIEWVSVVRLDQSYNIGLVPEWTDFQFFGNLLVCLNASGTIFLYTAMTGEIVKQLNVLQGCGINSKSDLLTIRRLSPGEGIEARHGEEVATDLTSQHSDSFKQRIFKRIVVGSHTSLLAIVDEFGVIYVICLADYIPEKCSSFKNLLPTYQRNSRGLLIGWEVGEADVGHQMDHTKFSDNGIDNTYQDIHHHNFQKEGNCIDLCISDVMATSKKTTNNGYEVSAVQSHITRTIFLTNLRLSDDDCICFSPFGITYLVRGQKPKNKKGSQLVHMNLRGASAIHDDSCLGARCRSLNGTEGAFVGEAVGCMFRGCFYLVRERGLSVCLSSISIPNNFLPIEYIGYRHSSISTCMSRQLNANVDVNGMNRHFPPLKTEILDRALIYESTEEADRLCLENGWDLKLSRIRRLQIALDYLKFDEIERSLEMLVDVFLAEEGVLRLLFAAVYLILCRSGNDHDKSAASRLLVLGTSFAIKMLRKYGLEQQKSIKCMLECSKSTKLLPLPPIVSDKVQNEIDYRKKLHEMAQFLEIIRIFQCRLSSEFKLDQTSVNQVEASSLEMLQDESQLSIVPSVNMPLGAENNQESHYSLHETGYNSENLALMPIKPGVDLMSDDLGKASVIVPAGGVWLQSALPPENPKEMIARWKIDNLDLKNVVKDALLSGRLPLAVLQLHIHHSRDLVSDIESHDTFTEVRDIGRAIAYDLFLKGETELAIATLQRLGDDIEASLKQLLFGTVRRSLRSQIANVMKRYGYLGPYEWKLLDTISLVENLYPSSCFWKTYHGRQEKLSLPLDSLLPAENRLCISHSHLFNNLIIECGEIDGSVLGSWTKIEEISTPEVDEENAHIGYWAAAAVWGNAWDQRTVDRLILDQSFPMGIHILWDSQLDYHMSRNNWAEVSRLLDLVPVSSISAGVLQVCLDAVEPASAVECKMKSSDYGNYLCSLDEVDSVYMEVPDVKIFKFSNINSSLWLRMLIEEKLAKKFIFLKDYWEGTTELVALLSRSGFVSSPHSLPCEENLIETSNEGGTVQALHKLFIHHCGQNNLPNLLDLYLDRHNLSLDDNSLHALLEAAEDFNWARWLLFSRIEGFEYEASFANARSVMSRSSVPVSNLGVLEVDEIIRTVDDIADGGGEMAALATLVYASAPVQNCLKSGSVNRHSNSTSQCTLENLRPKLQRYPTLWRTLVTACLGQDATGNILVVNPKNVLSEYLTWRDNIFFSAGRDTSLLQMLPCWFPKAVRRLMQLYIQGPFGCQSISCFPTTESWLHRDIDFLVNVDVHSEISAISLEATIQKQIEDELYGTKNEEKGIGLDHHLHRGRALAAFNHILASRAQNIKTDRESGASSYGQANIPSDVQTLLSPVRHTEESLLSYVLPHAIIHFEDSILVASCAFLLELCGLSASKLRVDVAALRRISSFYKSSKYNENFRQASPTGFVLHTLSHESEVTESLAQALADEYLHKESAGCNEIVVSKSSSRERISRHVMLVLHHLEKASLPQLVDQNSCGSWLLSGNGNGTELRSQQKAASQRWSLVTLFCRMHQLPLSTKYLAFLAQDNDWVGFLSEAQLGGYPFDTVVQIASKEFSDPRLKVHILTVLKGIQSKKKASTSSYSDVEKGNESSFHSKDICVPVELFRILADCEKQNNPGQALLMKAKDLSWSLLAIIASCFPDVSPLSCLTIWLEITAARETSSIKVNDIASQIARNVEAAVEATNALPASSRIVAFSYNRQSPKRRRLMEPVSLDLSAAVSSSMKNSVVGKTFVQGITCEEEKKAELSDSFNESGDSDEEPASLSKMIAVLCEQLLFLPLLRAFEMFLPSSSLLPFIRALQAFSQMRLSEASAHLGSFSARIKEETSYSPSNIIKGQFCVSWISSTAVKAADSMLSTCPSPYEKRCLLQLLAATDFGDGGTAAMRYRRLYWKINLAEPLLRKDVTLHLGNETLDDASLLSALETSRHWDQARNWAKQMEASGGSWKHAVHHVTETQAESMVAEWKEFLWDVPEERVALWSHCQTLFLRYSFPALQAGLFFLKHAEAVEKDLPASELHELLLLSLQWLSGMISQSHPVCPWHLLREIETKVWLLAVESETQIKSEKDLNNSSRDPIAKHSLNIIDRTASVITKMDNHISAIKSRTTEKGDMRDFNQSHQKDLTFDALATSFVGGAKAKRRSKGHMASRRPAAEPMDKPSETNDDGTGPFIVKNELNLQDEKVKVEMSFSRWEERVGAAEMEKAVLSLLEFGQITAAKQLQHKLSPGNIPSEFRLVDTALRLAAIATPSREVSISLLDEEVLSALQRYGVLKQQDYIDPQQILESLVAFFTEGSGRGLCKRIIAVVKAANVLGLSFSEAFSKLPIELLQLLSLKAQESFEEAYALVQSHSMAAASIAQILAESFLKGLLAAHRGGYMDSQKEEGPAPLLWRFADFLKWAELCPSEPEIGHALMRLVITGQEIPHACEVELLILSHHFYKSSACLDGVDVLVALAATRVDAYVSEGDFACLARLITGVGNFHALNFILGILIENGQLDLLLQKYSAAAATNTSTAEAVRGFRMAVLTSLKHFNSNDLDAFAMVYNHFDMKHETAALLESRAEQSYEQWFRRYDKDQNEDLLDAMRYYIEAAQVHSSIDAGNKTRRACAQASLLSLQIRIPDIQWLNLSETNARRALVEQSRFQEALIVAEAYGLNQSSEWALVLWNQMLKPEVMEEFVAEFVAVLPLQPSMLLDLARFYRAEVAARGDQSQFSVWLTGGGLPADWAKYLGRSFRCLLKRTRDLRLRLQLAQIATGFGDVIDACMIALDKVPDNASPLVLRKGHGGAYLPLM